MPSRRSRSTGPACGFYGFSVGNNITLSPMIVQREYTAEQFPRSSPSRRRSCRYFSRLRPWAAGRPARRVGRLRRAAGSLHGSQRRGRRPDPDTVTTTSAWAGTSARSRSCRWPCAARARRCRTKSSASTGAAATEARLAASLCRGEHRLDVDCGHQFARERSLVRAEAPPRWPRRRTPAPADQGRVGPPAAIDGGGGPPIRWAWAAARPPARNAATLATCQAARSRGTEGQSWFRRSRRPLGARWDHRLERSRANADQIRLDPDRPCRPATPRGALRRPCLRFAPARNLRHRPHLYGVQQFHYRGSRGRSLAAAGPWSHPDRGRHDGPTPAKAAAFAYRMLYLDPAAISQALDGASPPYVADAVAHDGGDGTAPSRKPSWISRSRRTTGRRRHDQPSRRPARRGAAMAVFARRARRLWR